MVRQYTQKRNQERETRTFHYRSEQTQNDDDRQQPLVSLQERQQTADHANFVFFGCSHHSVVEAEVRTGQSFRFPSLQTATLPALLRVAQAQVADFSGMVAAGGRVSPTSVSASAVGMELSIGQKTSRDGWLLFFKGVRRRSLFSPWSATLIGNCRPIRSIMHHAPPSRAAQEIRPGNLFQS